MVKTYDPGQVAATFGGFILHGFADGTFIKAERNEVAYTQKIGVDGEGTRSKSNNKSGKLTITLMQSSTSNADLSGVALLDETSGKGILPFTVKDNSGSDVFFAATAWIVKFPDPEYAKEVSTRVWVIETDNISIFLGGNT